MRSSLRPTSLGFSEVLDFLEVISFTRLGSSPSLFFPISFPFLALLFSFWQPYDSDFGTFKVVSEFPKPLLIFLNSCFFILFWLNVYFFLLVQTIDLSPSFHPFTVGSLYIFLYFTFHSLHFFLYFVTILIHFCEHLITSVLNSASDRLSMSLSLSSFSGFLSVLSFGPHFFVSMHLLYCKGWRLRYSPGQGNPPCWVVSLYVGRGQRGNNAACSALTPLLVTSPTTHKQIGPFCC